MAKGFDWGVESRNEWFNKSKPEDVKELHGCLQTACLQRIANAAENIAEAMLGLLESAETRRTEESAK